MNSGYQQQRALEKENELPQLRKRRILEVLVKIIRKSQMTIFKTQLFNLYCMPYILPNISVLIHPKFFHRIRTQNSFRSSRQSSIVLASVKESCKVNGYAVVFGGGKSYATTHLDVQKWSNYHRQTLRTYNRWASYYTRQVFHFFKIFNSSLSSFAGNYCQFFEK